MKTFIILILLSISFNSFSKDVCQYAGTFESITLKKDFERSMRPNKLLITTSIIEAGKECKSFYCDGEVIQDELIPIAKINSGFSPNL